jgi:sortase (surface protein transpeptidase)
MRPSRGGGSPRSRDLVVGAGLVVAILVLLWLAANRGAHAPPAVRATSPSAAPPRRVAIPAIGVSAPVIPLGLNRDGTLATPTDFSQTGWYTAGPEPGERGAAVIVGHVDSKTGPAVFYRLAQLRRRDVIHVARTDGTTVSFRVDKVEQWPKAQFPTRRVYGRTRRVALRLVTCSGDFNRATGHYLDNTIVFASRG